ncbi:MAG: glycosyl transferase [Deltaproteobacteria bacterium]|nr:MAG: glycosyl transferase [Deltaproteobacteria bacterium]
MNKHKLTIVTVVLNAADTIRDCIESVLAQNYLAEHIIIDGGSTDNTLEIIKEYDSKHYRLVSEPDSGIYDAMNKGIGLATGDVIGLLNADDIYAGPYILSKVARVFSEKNVESCYGDLVYVREKRRPKVKGERLKGGDAGGQRAEVEDLIGKNYRIVRYWKSGDYKPGKFYWGWMPPHPTFFVRRAIYEKYGLFNDDLGSAADYELMLRFLLKNRISAAYIPEMLVKMRVGGASNASLTKRIKANKMDRRAWEVNGLRPYPWTLWMKPLRKVGQFFSKP